MTNDAAEVQQTALRIGLRSQPIELVRHGSNSIYRLPDGVVARAGRPGSDRIAAHEVAVAAWLHQAGIETVRPLDNVPQPTITGTTARPITWWHELPPHQPATPAELSHVLASLHQVPVPARPALDTLEPFTTLTAQIAAASTINEPDRTWLQQHLERLRLRWTNLPPSGRYQGQRVVHGDAWQGNVASTDNDHLILLDLEHVAIGPAEWDLTTLAVDHTDFGRIDTTAYQSFVNAYGGYDVTSWPGYRTIADIWELRWTCFALTRANHDQHAANEAKHRLACLQGELDHPWTWNPL